MAKFAYNNIKDINTGHMLFELNCGYYPWVLYQEDVNLWSKSKIIDELLIELKKFIIICYKSLYYSQELQKQAYNKVLSPGAIPSAIKFGSIANTSRPNKIKS